ncbi:MAG: hypothetical protein LBC63_01735, partial [Holophagales bacterium]|nr:hypothetical protein [Holophagales bacterium]
ESTNRSTPTQVGNSKDWVAAMASAVHTVALKKDGTAWAWGANAGLLGDGTETDRNTPVQVGKAQEQDSTVHTRQLQRGRPLGRTP